ncbi:ethanolamine utilization protein EutJ [Desemzia sp. C1]|uniref:ethanolamine utilization protein EutJ n=1 Tax=Desemzia sp. C1 TaxID=2892016 RepID=UPI001E547211|nr:ethanolamine utilization protein EutJ [Desemzia sp. C1]MCI3029304.1 ethanolamine utilization protein EutJ [Desemzia sp. C1]
MQEVESANEVLETFNQIVNTGKVLPFDKKNSLKVGIDLGTSSIVLVVLDDEDNPVYGSFQYANVIRDGLVVNYIQAVEIVRKLKADAEEAVGRQLTVASGAVPPGTIGKNKSVVGNVIESAEMEVDNIVDEPTAAACLLKINDGYVVDVGGGTTGISVFEKGEIQHVLDEPTGGTHMTLVLAGYHNVSYEEAEQIKRDKKKERENFLVIQPVVEKMAEITRKAIENSGYITDSPIYLVGGASNFSDFTDTFSKYLNKAVVKPSFPQFVTPIGIAMNCGKEAE